MLNEDDRCPSKRALGDFKLVTMLVFRIGSGVAIVLVNGVGDMVLGIGFGTVCLLEDSLEG